MEKGLKLETATGVRYSYHDPCHSPMKQYQPLKVVNQLMNESLNGSIERNERCCGESGTFAVTRPEIATQVRFRKEQEMLKAAEALRAAPESGQSKPAEALKVLTSCPSCLQGLQRFKDVSGMEADYIVVEMARHLLGPQWLPEYVAKANQGGIERVLV